MTLQPWIPGEVCMTHNILMDWVENPAHPEGGYWFCEQCWLDEEADFDPEHSDWADNNLED